MRQTLLVPRLLKIVFIDGVASETYIPNDATPEELKQIFTILNHFYNIPPVKVIEILNNPKAYGL